MHNVMDLEKNFLSQEPEMCGRFVLMTPGRSLAERFKLEEVPDLEPRYNVAPTQRVAWDRILKKHRKILLH